MMRRRRKEEAEAGWRQKNKTPQGNVGKYQEPNTVPNGKVASGALNGDQACPLRLPLSSFMSRKKVWLLHEQSGSPLELKYLACQAEAAVELKELKM